MDLAPIAGSWTNLDPATGGILRLVIGGTEGVPLVHAYGACVPEPCDWGRVAGLAYAGSVSGRAACAFTARYDFPAMTTMLAGQLDGAHLVVSAFTVFRDGSGRASYLGTGRFGRAA